MRGAERFSALECNEPDCIGPVNRLFDEFGFKVIDRMEEATVAIFLACVLEDHPICIAVIRRDWTNLHEWLPLRDVSGDQADQAMLLVAGHLCVRLDDFNRV